MGDEGRECRVEDRLARLPPEDNRFLVIVQTLPRNALIVPEGILVPADETVEVMTYRKVYILSSGEAQYIGETLYLAFACTSEADRIRAPIHLTLLPWFRFKPYYRLSIRNPHIRHPLFQNADSSSIAGVLQFLEYANTCNTGIFLKQSFYFSLKGVQLARPFLFFL